VVLGRVASVLAEVMALALVLALVLGQALVPASALVCPGTARHSCIPSWGQCCSARQDRRMCCIRSRHPTCCSSTCLSHQLLTGEAQRRQPRPS